VAALAVGVGETEYDGSAWFPGCRVEADRLMAGRDADGCDPLLPLAGVLWFPVGVQQQVAAERAAPALFLE
jgi:hypothetical protein